MSCKHVSRAETYLVLDELPDDAGHLIAVHINDCVGNLDSGVLLLDHSLSEDRN